MTTTKLRITLDTACVIHAASHQKYEEQIDALAQRCKQGHADLFLTTAYDDDQATAGDDKRAANLHWLAAQPVIGTIPQPFLIGYSKLDDPRSVLVSDRTSDAWQAIEKILLPPNLRAGRLDPANEELMRRWRKRIIDVQHLASHFASGNDLFVTSDDDDMIKKRGKLERQTGIVVVNPAEAVTRLKSAIVAS